MLSIWKVETIIPKRTYEQYVSSREALHRSVEFTFKKYGATPTLVVNQENFIYWGSQWFTPMILVLAYKVDVTSDYIDLLYEVPE